MQPRTNKRCRNAQNVKRFKILKYNINLIHKQYLNLAVVKVKFVNAINIAKK